MNYKNCTHYNEVVRVLSENGSLEDINFKLEETKGCECEVNEDSVCELWVTLAFAHDMAPQMGIAHAEQTIANLDTRMKEIATKLVINVGNKLESVEETETISETNIDSQLFAALPEEKQQLIEQLLELGDVTFVKSDSFKIKNESVNEAKSELNNQEFESYEITQSDIDDLPCLLNLDIIPIEPELLEKYKNAYQELVTEEPAYLSKINYLQWLDKYKDLFSDRCMYRNEVIYSTVYNNLYSLTRYFDDEEEAQKALSKFDIIDKKNEIEVLQWLSNYEEVGLRIFMMGVYFFDNDSDFLGNYTSLLSTEELYFDRRDFEVLIYFGRTFNSHYWERLEKYNTHVKEPLENFNESSEENENMSSLTYHLKKRGMLK